MIEQHAMTTIKTSYRSGLEQDTCHNSTWISFEKRPDLAHCTFCHNSTWISFEKLTILAHCTLNQNSEGFHTWSWLSLVASCKFSGVPEIPSLLTGDSPGCTFFLSQPLIFWKIKPVQIMLELCIFFLLQFGSLSEGAADVYVLCKAVAIDAVFLVTSFACFK